MKHKLIATVGLPGAGKSFWARTQDAFRVNKDDIRQALHGGIWSKENERDVIRYRDKTIREHLKDSDVISDDTNFAEKHITNLRKIAQECGAEFEIKYFTDVSLEECIKRDAGRSGRAHVGESVIRDMYDQFLRPVVKQEIIHGLPTCICTDIDGTIADGAGLRSMYDWHKVGVDKPKQTIIDIFLQCKADKKFILSGRDGICRSETIQWLFDHDVTYDGLFMREAGDMRKDSIIKREIYDREIKGKYNVLFILDDRNQVVDLWRRDLGLTCLQVAYGNF